MVNGDEKKVTDAVSVILSDTISYYDYNENYYHAFIAGLFSGAGYLLSSNDENGIGRSDVIVKDRKTRKVIIIEISNGIDVSADAIFIINALEREIIAIKRYKVGE